MAWTRRTWLWIIGGIVAFGVLCVIALAAFGMYFISSHVQSTKTTSAEAFKAFDEAKARFKDERPLLDIDNRERPKFLRNPSEMPTATQKAEHLWVLVWEPDEERLVRVSLPFWLLRFGRKIDIGGKFDVERLRLDFRELERIGPTIVIDHRPTSGERIFVWTQ